MRVVLFCSAGAESVATLEVLLEAHTVELAVLPLRRGDSFWKRSLRRLLGREGPTETLLRRKRIPILRIPRRPAGRDLARLEKITPEVVCVAAYPFLFTAPMLERMACPIINFHPSLLPRHRGPLPLFWMFHGDDRQTGATIHLVDRGMDSGPILAQSGFELPRGAAVSEVAERIRRCGADLMGQVLADWPRALGDARTQDEARATLAPRVRPGRRMVNFADWGCERVWHFLHGVFPYFVEPLEDGAGAGVNYRSVLGYQAGAPQGPPGSVARQENRWLLNCKDGVVTLGTDRASTAA